ncbi:hypothetical protein [Patulibacter defluvii]|uniref:hypothetical protein n=1 Tax=Patulibacter defluvii TaxID=3095358 RepID=UPI002A7543CC|nr:hypothetical protein [Patulibacter sp. DM4]
MSVPTARSPLALLLAVLMTLVALAGCGGGETTTGPAPASTTATTATTTTSGDPTAPYDRVEGGGPSTGRSTATPTPTPTGGTGTTAAPPGPCAVLPGKGPIARLLVPGCSAAIDGVGQVTAVARDISACRPTDFACGVRTIVAMRPPIERLIRSDRQLERSRAFRRLPARCRAALLRPAGARRVLREARAGVDRVLRAHRADDLPRLASAMQQFAGAAGELADAVGATVRPAAVREGCGVDLG